MPWTSIMPTGGVDPSEENLTEWFKAGVTCVGMGSQLISSELIKSKDFIKLEENVRLAMSIIQKLRQLYPVKV
jgi:2-dehydro-3-deoxyphosphogluconate aldolase/(4S)-4-hydroxy-2-oxoglutarate aldolase